MMSRHGRNLVVAGLWLIATCTVRAQGPDDKGAVLRGFGEAPPAPAASAPPSAAATRPTPTPIAKTPEYLKQLFPDTAPADALGEASGRKTFAFPQDAPDINQDIQVTPSAGAWMIFIISYPGANGPQHARNMVSELRSRRVPAYVFSYGAEERKKEFDRVRKILQEQQEFFRKEGLSPEQGVRVRYQNIEVQHAVLVGGYADADSAKRALDGVRNWTPPDPTKVALETQFYKESDAKGGRAEAKYVNPFKRAFVVRNPTVKPEVAKDDKKLDIKMLRAMNADESFSLLKCPKAFTLAVKEFQTPFMMNDRDTSATVWDKLGVTSKADRVDGAALSAHNLVDSLRKRSLEAYVLHSKFSSVVTVGSFDSPDDPALKSMQDLLATRFSQPPFSLVQFFHRPVPMPVPQ